MVLSDATKTALRSDLRACDLAPSVLRTAPLDRSPWRQCCSNATSAFEKRRTAALVAKRKARKNPVAARWTMMWTCDVCGRPCASRLPVCPSQVAPMTRGSVDLDDSVHRVCVCVCVRACVRVCVSSTRCIILHTTVSGLLVVMIADVICSIG